MKRTLLFIALCAMTLTVTVAKKKKSKQAAPVAVEMKSASDTISYAAGYANTQGLLPYLQSQLGVDTAYMADFVKGFKDAKDKVSDPAYSAYIAGTQIAKMVEDRMIAGISAELKGGQDTLVREVFYEGFIAALEKDTTKFDAATASQRFQAAMEAVKKAKEEKARMEGVKFLEENKNKPGVVTTPSGLQYKVLTQGTGEKPVAEQEVTVKYEGKLVDGTVFDSSYKRGNGEAKFKANQVIKGWTEALTMMPVGSKWELYIPENLGYGARQAGKIPAYSTLIFTVELVGVTPLPQVEPAEQEKEIPATKLVPAKKKPAAKAKVTKKK